MVRRVWLGLLPVLALTAGPVAAQDEFSLKVEDSRLVQNLRDGKKPLRDSSGNIPPENQKAIDAVAHYEMMRITSEVNRGLKPGNVEKAPDLVKQAADYLLVIENPQGSTNPKRYSESQKDFIQAYGKACVANLRTVLGTPDKPSKFEPFVRINACRLLATVARSGYEECADLAVEIIDNPKESDGVRYYCLQALKNLFAAYNVDFPEKSVITKADRELKAVQSLINFIMRKPAVNENTPADEVEALRYIRREAVRALGYVRKPIYRTDKTVVAVPALVLLKVAAIDTSIQPTPSLSERVEATLGYLQLTPDRQENMDYAVFYLGKITRDLAKEFNDKQVFAVDPKATPKDSLSLTYRDYYAWKYGAARLEAGLKSWKATWDTENPAAPQPASKLMTDLVAKANDYVYGPITGLTSGNKTIDGTVIDDWVTQQLNAGVFANTMLFKDLPDDPAYKIAYPNP
ncbi:MAG: hypothetical protein ACJ8F7_21150 [Gemmataceae bacterium]